MGKPEAPCLVTTKTRVELTERMRAFAARRVEELADENLAGYLFKSKSPSCGFSRTKVYTEQGMATVEYKGKSFEVDEDGFLQKFEDWSQEWVEYVKESEGIKELSEEHQKVIEFLQDYYKKNGIAPMDRMRKRSIPTKDAES